VDEATAVALLLTEGQRHDSVPFAAVYAQAAAAGAVQRVIADKAYDANAIRDLLAADGVKTTIPSPPQSPREGALAASPLPRAAQGRELLSPAL
jgi:transposase